MAVTKKSKKKSAEDKLKEQNVSLKKEVSELKVKLKSSKDTSDKLSDLLTEAKRAITGLEQEEEASMEVMRKGHETIMGMRKNNKELIKQLENQKEEITDWQRMFKVEWEKNDSLKDILKGVLENDEEEKDEMGEIGKMLGDILFRNQEKEE